MNRMGFRIGHAWSWRQNRKHLGLLCFFVLLLICIRKISNLRLPKERKIAFFYIFKTLDFRHILLLAFF